MKIGRCYWVWIDPKTGHIWNDEVHASKNMAICWVAPKLELKNLKLKKIRIVNVGDKHERKE